MIPVTSFAYAAGMLVVAGVYALWRSDDATAAGWGITATCGGYQNFAISRTPRNNTSAARVFGPGSKV